MTLKFEELKVLHAAETIADGIWKQVVRWDPFVRDTVGGQLARAADSIGANIAEAFGRFHFGEKIQFLYYARGNLYETKYWINRSQARQLITAEQSQNYAAQLSELARQLNAFISNLKSQKHSIKLQTTKISETNLDYAKDQITDPATSLFTEEEITWIETQPNI